MANDVLWSADEVARATGGVLHGVVTKPLKAVTIDSRSIAPGDVFCAIKGDTHDSHDFVVNALNAGAGLALVSEFNAEMAAAGPIVVVGDSLRGLEDLGRAARLRSKGKIIAVTGSVGKTSTKEMLRAALGAAGQTHVSAASFNNHWGVPLTLARLSSSAKFGVFEIGMNHAGEIMPLVDMVRPHVAIVTTVAASHLGHFHSLDEIAEAKSEILSGVVPGGAAVLNRDSPYFDFLADRAKINSISNIIGFGKHARADVRLIDLDLHPTFSTVTADVLGEQVKFRFGVTGAHMALNVLSVLAVIKLCGVDLALACAGLGQAENAKGRGGQEFLHLQDGDVLLLDESYNANPESMVAAFHLLSMAASNRMGRKIAVLGDMLELGQFSEELHRGLAKDLIEAKIDQVYASGPMMRHLFDALPPALQGLWTASAAEMTGVLNDVLRAGDSLVIKGSNGSKMGVLVSALRQSFAQTRDGEA